MKKLSEIYKTLQLCAINCDLFSDEEKVAAIEALLNEERIAKWSEEQEAKKEAEAE